MSVETNNGVYEFSIIPSNEMFYSDESGFGVYRFVTYDKIPHVQEVNTPFGDKSSQGFMGTLAGLTGKLEYGVKYNINAEVQYNDRYKSYQYKPTEVFPIKPNNLEDSRTFLLSCGISINQVNSLLEKHPTVIDKVINEEDVDLKDVKGIKEKSFEKIKDKILASYGSMELTLFLSPYGVSAKAIQSLFESGTNAKFIKSKIQENPYIITKIKGFGFKRADGIALKIKPEMISSLERAEAFVRFYLSDQASSNGHTWVGSEQFLAACRENIPECKDYIFQIIREGNRWLYIDRENKRLALQYYRDLEENIAKEILRIRDAQPNFIIDINKAENEIKEIEERQGWIFTDEQRDAIYTSISTPVIAVVGKAGSGKSSVTTAITALHAHLEIAQVALAGKAALRIQDINGFPASTIHRLLKFEMGEFVYNKHNKLDKDYIVLDEASMIGAELFYSLLQAIPSGARVVIMGDVGQLDSIGVGSVFKDLLSSKVVPIVNLTKIHRQAQKSAIITESIKVSKGINIVPSNFAGTKILGELQDLVLDISHDKEDTTDMIITRLKEELQYEDINEIQIIVPMKERGSACTYRLNNKIQQIVNPKQLNKMEVTLKANTNYSYVIREGDRVINTVNHYNTTNLSGELSPVFNGNLGTVTNIMAKEMIIDFVGIGEVIIPKEKWKSLELGYAITVHKCLTKDTILFTNKGLLSLEEFDNGADVGNFKNINNDILVYNGYTFEKPLAFYNNGESECIKITTKMGYNVKSTIDHKFVVLNEYGYTEEKEAQYINNTDVLLVAKGSNATSSDYYQVPDEWKNTNVNVRSTIYKKPNILDEEFGMFLGLFVGDGTLFEAGFRLVKRHKDVVDRFSEIVESIFGKQIPVTKLKHTNAYYAEFHSRDIATFLSQIDEIKPHNKQVPKQILRSPLSVQQAFLKGLFEDGTVNLKNGVVDHVELAAKDLKMLETIQLMLLNMGIISSVQSYNGKRNPILYIYGTSLNIFKNKIGFISKFKQERLDLISKKQFGYFYTNITPIISRIIEKHKLSPKDQNLKNSIKNNKISEYRLDLFLSKFGEIKDNDIDLLKEVRSNFITEKIKHKETFKENTYCIEMPDTHRFVQNGILGKNCQGSQFKKVIVGLDSSSYVMLSKELLYTAITRASKKCYLCGENSSVKQACSTSKVLLKNTFLKEILKEV